MATTLLDAFAKTVNRHRDKLALRTTDGSPGFTWGDWDTQARRLAAGLSQLGITAGDTVALLLHNRIEFYVADLAVLMLGAVPVSVYPTSAPEQIAFVLADSGAKMLVTERRLVGGSTGFTGCVVVVDDQADDEYDALRDAAPLAHTHRGSADELATVIYTSGTTGPPKGVELNHRSLLSAVAAMAERTGLGCAGGRTICWLPMAHVAARCATYYGAIVFGDEVTICQDPRQITTLVADIHPTWFFGVPRIWEKLRAATEDLIAAMPADARTAARNALDARTARVWRRQHRDGAPNTGPDGEALLASLRRAIGLDQVICAQVGAAPAAPDVVAFFRALGVPLTEIYGFSEGIVCSVPDRTGTVPIGSVGTPLAGMEIKLADDGEIHVRGNFMMNGYRNRPDTTADSYTPDGFFKTGDIGVLTDGQLRIVDRKKDLIINAAGKNMSPASIESVIKSGTPLIAQAVAIGDRRPYNVALICLDPEIAGGRAPADLHAEVMTSVICGNARLSRVEQIKRFAILDTPWLPGGDELTPTQKLKRRQIAQKYAATIDALYTTGDPLDETTTFTRRTI